VLVSGFESPRKSLLLLLVKIRRSVELRNKMGVTRR